MTDQAQTQQTQDEFDKANEQPVRVGFDKVMDEKVPNWKDLDENTLNVYRAVYAAGINDTMIGVVNTRQHVTQAVNFLVSTINQVNDNQSKLLDLMAQSIGAAPVEQAPTQN